MDALATEDMERYKGALEATGGTFDDIEPISRFHEAFQGEVDAAYAAAVVGLETEVFLEKIRENVGLQNIGLVGVREWEYETGRMDIKFSGYSFCTQFPDSPRGTSRRDAAEQKPGAVVRIPDLNLRAAIAEALGKSPNAPITVEEMERLGKT